MLEMLQSGWQQGGGGGVSKCNQSESTLARLTEWAEIWQGLGGWVRFRKPSSKCSLLWNRKCSFGEEDRHNGDHVRTHARTHSSTTLKLRLPGSRQKVRDCSALLCAAGIVVLEKLMWWAKTLQSIESSLLLILHTCLLVLSNVPITVWGGLKCCTYILIAHRPNIGTSSQMLTPWSRLTLNKHIMTSLKCLLSVLFYFRRTFQTLSAIALCCHTLWNFIQCCYLSAVSDWREQVLPDLILYLSFSATLAPQF